MGINSDTVYQIAIGELYRSTPAKARVLLGSFPSAEEAWQTLTEEKCKETLERAKREMEFIERHQLNTYYYQDADYPYRLRECNDAPIVLFGKGHIQTNKGKMVSIVGTRQATERGRETTERLVRELKQLVPDVTIISGLAYGIDVAAHRAALKEGLPTIIVPAHGLDQIYPPLHRPVAIEALKNGGILTEYMSGTAPEKYNFVARNRIVAGMADAVLVVESKDKGGSLITANLAVDYGRDVFAVAGRPSDESSLGCNRLIKEHKAALVDTAEDLVKAMQWDVTTKPNLQTEMVELWSDLSPLQQQILDMLRQSEDGMHVNQIVSETGQSYASISAELTMMEMDDIVKGLPGAVYRAIK